MATESGNSPIPKVNLDPSGDFYWEGPYIVFTEQYHLRRGSCCGSGCRHCPWRKEKTSAKKK